MHIGNRGFVSDDTSDRSARKLFIAVIEKIYIFSGSKHPKNMLFKFGNGSTHWESHVDAVQVYFDTTNTFGVPKLTQLTLHSEGLFASRFA